MVDRRSKHTPDDLGRPKTTKECIMDFLRRNERMRLKEIKEELAKVGISYASNKGLLLALDGMIEDQMIRREPAKPYPYYHIPKNPITDLARIAEAFKLGVIWATNKPRCPILNYRLPYEGRVQKLLQFYGAYMMYVQIQKWKVKDPKKSRVENWDLECAWLRYTILLDHSTKLFNDLISNISRNRWVLIPEESTEETPVWGTGNLPEAFEGVERIFRLYYPEYQIFFDAILERAPQDAERYKKGAEEARARYKKEEARRKRR